MAELRRQHWFKATMRGLWLWSRWRAGKLRRALIGRKRSTKFVGVVFLVVCFWLYQNSSTHVQHTLTAHAPEYRRSLLDQDSSRDTLPAPPRHVDPDLHNSWDTLPAPPRHVDPDQGSAMDTLPAPPRRHVDPGRQLLAPAVALDADNSWRNLAVGDEGAGPLDGEQNKDRDNTQELFSMRQNKAGGFVPYWDLDRQKGKTDTPLHSSNRHTHTNVHPPTQEIQTGLRAVDIAGNPDQTDEADSLEAPPPERTNGMERVADREPMSWKTTQSRRQRQIEEYCKGETHSRVKVPTRFTPPINNIIILGKNSKVPTRLITPPMNNIIIPEKNLLYCPVEKSASTFLRRFMYSLVRAKGSDRVVSPFAVPIKWALTYKFQSLKMFDLRQRVEFDISSSVRLMVTREPYSRLFSAYVDKLLVPNSFFWKTWGRPIVRRRRRPTLKAIRCAHDVTFPEFVEYVIKRLHVTDNHVKPVSKICSPCASNFSVIGHLETLTSDFEHLTSELNVTVANFSTEYMSTQLSHDAIKDSASSAVHFQEKLQQCVTRYGMWQRLWLKLQLRGIIENRIGFPLTPREADDVSYYAFLQLLTEARQNSNDVKKLRAQKLQALENAFAEVPPAHISRLVEIYEADFEMFGYEKYPSFISQTTE